MSRSFIQLSLTCSDIEEANNISTVLLDKHLIACAKTTSVNSAFHWQGKIDHDLETLLIMDSAADLFDEIDQEVRSLHSYETINLQAITTSYISKQTVDWLNENLKSEY
jgi:periplasmic divalent cation tolerance protein